MHKSNITFIVLAFSNTHSTAELSIKGDPRGLVEMGRMFIYIQGAGEHLQLFRGAGDRLIVLGSLQNVKK